MAWLSPVLLKLQSNDTTINPLGVPVTIPQISIMGSIPPIAGIIGLIVSVKISDFLGRKKILIITAVAFLCSVIITTFANHIYFYYSFLFFRGYAVASYIYCIPVYINEISEDGNRGRMGCLMGIAIPLGVLLGFLFGPITSVRGFTLICGIPVLLHLILSIFTPESPVFLTLKGRKMECLRTLERLRMIKNVAELEKEYEKMQMYAANRRTNRNFLDIFRNRATRKAFLISTGVCIVQQFSGIYTFLAFMGTIFDKTGVASGNTFGIITGFVQVGMSLIAVLLVDRLGRRSLLLTSSITISISLFLLGFYFYLQHIESVLFENLTWVPVFGISLYLIGYGLGLECLPMVLASELFPNDLRAKGCGSTLVMNNLAIFFVSFCFPLVSAYLGVEYCMWFFSSSCFLGFIVMFFVLPETKGKSFIKIQEMLEK